MSDWSDGYVTEIGYTYGYYPELNPLRAQWTLLSAGIEPPASWAEGFTACELGFGQGISINMHAAAAPGEWWGTDFIPAQAAFAEKLGRASGAQVHLHDDAFAAFAQRPGLPQFDFIALHGIWSWVSDENRRVIVDFLTRHLRVGGVAYIAYNTLPGWATGMPLRHLMTQHARALPGAGEGLAQRIGAAMDFAQEIFDLKPAGLGSNPQMAERLARMKEQDRSYLAHEYFNRDWKPMYFSEMAEWLAPAKLDFVASAAVLENYRVLHHTPDMVRKLDTIADPVLRETVQDLSTNQQFRKDLWVRGAQRLTANEVAARMRQQRVVLSQNPDKVVMKVKGSAGEMQLDEAVYRPIIDFLADHQPRSVGEIERGLGERTDWRRLREVLTVLIGTGAVSPAQAEAAVEARRPYTDRLNSAIANLSTTRMELVYLASPVSGGGVPVSRIEQFFLAAHASGAADPRDWAALAARILAANGERLLKDGQPVDDAQQALQMLVEQAGTFAATRLPILRGLGVAR